MIEKTWQHLVMSNKSIVNAGAFIPTLKTYMPGLSWESFVFMSLGMFTSMMASAADQIPDTTASASNRSQITQSLNGTPVQNIVAPNSAGLSHNKFSTFNVSDQNLIINNSNIDVVSKLGGAMSANPNLGTGNASMILNEVTSANRSILQGAQELVGSRADYILANPNGITCDGCGFINFPRTTLTTGSPILSGGSLTGFNVDKGDVLIEALGLSVEQADFFDIISRSITINGEIWSTDQSLNDLSLIAGRNTVDYATRVATAKADDGSTKPVFAIDSSILGGMYAGRISLIGTEAGVGVSLLSDMAASVDDITLNADGKITFSGNEVSAARDIIIESTQAAATAGNEIELTGSTIYATNNLSVTGGDLGLSGGRSGAGNDVTIAANSYTDSGSGQRDAGNNLSLMVTGNTTIDGTTLQGNNRAAVSASNLTLQNGGTVTAVNAAGALDIQINNALTLNNGALGSGGTATINADTISLDAASNNNGAMGIHSVGAATVTANISIDNTGFIGGDSQLTVSTDTLTNRNGGVLYSQGTVMVSNGGGTGTSLTTETGSEIKGGTLDLNYTTVSNAGTLYGQTSANILATTLTNTGLVSTLGSLTLNQIATGSLSNTGGSIEAGTLSLTFNDLINSGDIYIDTSATLTVDVLNNTGSISSPGTLNINSTVAGTSLSNNGGSIEANTLRLGFNSIDNLNAGILYGTQSWDITTNALTNSGTIASDNTLELSQAAANQTLTNNAAGDIDATTLIVDYDIINNAGTLYAGTGGATIATDSLNNSGNIASAGALSLSQSGVGVLTNQASGFIDSLSTIDLSFNTITNSGTVIGDGNVTLATDVLTNSGIVTSVGALTLNQLASGSLVNNVDGELSGGTFSINFNSVDNTGLISAGTNGSITATTLTNTYSAGAFPDNNGTIAAGTTLILTDGATTGTLTNNISTTIKAADIDIQFDTITNDGDIYSTTSTDMTTTTLTNNANLLSDGRLTINSDAARGTTLINNSIIAAADLDLYFNAITNYDKLYGDTTLDAGSASITNYGGIHSAGDMSLAVTNLINTPLDASYAADIIANGNLTISGNHTLINQTAFVLTPRIVATTGILTIDSTAGDVTTQSVLNDGGFIYAGSGMSIYVSRELINSTASTIYANSGTMYLGAAYSVDDATTQSNLQAAAQDVSVLNTDSTIENYLGDINIIASIYENNSITVIPTVNTSTYTVTDTLTSFYDGVNYHDVDGAACGTIWDDNFDLADTCVKDISVYEETLNAGDATVRSKLLAGTDISIWVEQSAKNYASIMSAGGNISIDGATGSSFINEAVVLRTSETATIYTDADGGSASVVNFASLGAYCGYDGIRTPAYAGSNCFYIGPDEHHKTWTSFTPTKDYFTVAVDSTVEAGGTITISTTSVTNTNSTINIQDGAAEGGASPVYTPTADGGSTSTAPTTSAVTLTVNTQGLSVTPTSTTETVSSSTINTITITTLDLSPLLLNSITALASSPFFTLSANPTAFLFETDPSLISLASLYGSDLFLEGLGLDPTAYLRLGDAYYEQQLLRQQLLAEAGQRFIADGFADENEQFKYLLDNGIQAGKDLQLRVGVTLTAEQINSLEKDIVWMVEAEVNGQTVLIPQLFLSSSTRADLASGAKFVGSDINIMTEGPVSNSGAFVATNSINVDAGTTFTNRLGSLRATNGLNITARDDILNESGSISGGDVTLTSTEGSVRNVTLTREFTTVGAFGSGVNTIVGDTAIIESTNDLTIKAADDIVSEGGQLNAGNDATLDAGDEINLTVIEVKSYSEDYDVNQTTETTSTDSSNSTTTNTTFTSTSIQHTGSQGSGLTTGGNLTISSGGDTNVVGSDVEVGGDLNIEKIGGDLNVTTYEETTVIHSESTEITETSSTSVTTDENKGDHALTSTANASASTSTTTTTTDITATTHNRSGISVGGNINSSEGAIAGDVNITGSDVAAGGDITLDTQGDINILAAEDRIEMTYESETNTVGVEASANLNGASAGANFEHSETTGSATQTTAQVSTLTSGGNMNLIAGGDFTEQGTEVSAGGDINIDADSVTSLAAEDTYTESSTTESHGVGLSVGLDVGLGDLAGSFIDDTGNASLDMAGAAKSLGGLDVPDAGSGSVELGYSYDKTTSGSSSTTKVVSSFASGGNVNITAREGDATFEGTSVEAADSINVTADKGDVKILAAENTESSYSDTTSAEVSIGVSGDGEVSLSGSGGTEHEDSKSMTNTVASFKAGNDVNLTAKNDVEMVGTQIEAGGSASITAEEGAIDYKAAYDTSESNSNSKNANASISGSNSGGSIGGGYSTSTTKESSSTGQAGSISATNISFNSKKDITLEGTNLDATEGVSITSAEGKLDYKAVTDTYEKTTTGMSAEGEISASKTGGGISGGGSSTDEYEQSTTRTGGTINATNLTINTQGARLEGTEVTADSGSINTGEGALVIESAVSTHTKTVNNTSVEAGLEADVKEKSGSAHLKVEGAYEDTYSETNKNANLNIGNLDIKAKGGIDVKGSNVTGLNSVVTGDKADGGTINTNGAEVRTEVREDVSRSEKSNIDISVGVVIPSKKIRDKTIGKVTDKVKNSDFGNKVKNKFDSAKTSVKNKVAGATTGIKNKVSGARTSVKNVGKDSATRDVNNKVNETKKQENNTKLANTVKTNKDASTDRKLANNIEHADKKATIADAKQDKKQVKKDQKADYDRQKADDVATGKRDKEIAAVDKDKTLTESQREQKKKDIDQDFTNTKKLNADTAADAKKQNPNDVATIERTRTDNDRKADEDQQKADDVATRKHDDKVAAVDRDKTLTDIQRDQKKKDLDQELANTKKQNTGSAADTKKQNALNTAAVKAEYAKKTADRKVKAQTKAEQSKIKHSEKLRDKNLAVAGNERDTSKANADKQHQQEVKQAEAKHKQEVSAAARERDTKIAQADTRKQEADIAAKAKLDERVARVNKDEKLKQAAGERDQKRADAHEQYKQDEERTKDTYKQVIEVADQDKERRIVRADNRKKSADEAAKQDYKKEKARIEKAPNLSDQDRVKKLTENQGDLVRKQAANETAFQTSKDRAQRKYDKATTQANQDVTTSINTAVQARDSKKSDADKTYSDSGKELDKKIAQAQTKYDAAKTKNENYLQSVTNSADQQRDAAVSQAGTEKNDAVNTANQASNTKIIDANIAFTKNKDELTKTHEANEQRDKGIAAEEIKLINADSDLQKNLHTAAEKKLENDSEVISDDRLSETQKSRKLMENDRELAAARESANKEHADAARDTGDNKDKHNQEWDKKLVDGSDLSDADKLKKKTEIDKKYTEQKQLRAEEHANKIAVDKAETRHVKEVSSAEHEHRKQVGKADDALKTAETTANTDKTTRDQAAETTKDSDVRSVDSNTALSDDLKEQKKREIEAKYQQDLIDSESKYASDIADARKDVQEKREEADEKLESSKTLSDAVLNNKRELAVAKAEEIRTKAAVINVKNQAIELSAKERTDGIEKAKNERDTKHADADKQHKLEAKQAETKYKQEVGAATRERDTKVAQAETRKKKADIAAKAKAKRDERIARVNKDEKLKQAAGERDQKRADAHEQYKQDEERTKDTYKQKIDAADQDKERRIVRAENRKKSADEAAKKDYEKEKVRIEKDPNLSDQDRAKKLAENQSDFDSKQAANATAYQTSKDRAQRKNDQAATQANQDVTTSINAAVQARDSKKADAEKAYSDSEKELDNKIAEAQTKYDVARAQNENELKSVTDRANQQRDAAVSRADTEKNDVVNTANQVKDTKKTDADTAFDQNKDELTKTHEANEKRKEGLAAEEIKRVKSDGVKQKKLVEASDKKIIKDSEVIADDRLNETQKSRKLMENDRELAAARESANKEHADAARDTGDNKDKHNQEWEKKLVDGSDLSDADKLKKKTEIDKKYAERKQLRAEHLNNRIAVYKAETKLAQEVSRAEHEHRKEVNKTDKALKTSEATANTDKTSRDQAAETTKDSDVRSVDSNTALSDDLKEQKKREIEAKYQQDLIDSESKHASDIADARKDAQEKREEADEKLESSKTLSDAVLNNKRELAVAKAEEIRTRVAVTNVKNQAIELSAKERADGIEKAKNVRDAKYADADNKYKQAEQQANKEHSEKTREAENKRDERLATAKLEQQNTVTAAEIQFIKEKSRIEDDASLSDQDRTKKLTEIQKSYDDKKADNAQAFKNTKDSADNDYKDAITQADKDKADSMAAADTTRTAAKGVADTVFGNRESNLDSEYDANIDRAKKNASDQSKLAVDKRLLDESLSNKRHEKQKKDMQIQDDSTLTAQQKSRKLKQNSVDLATAQETARTAYADAEKKVRNDVDDREKQKELTLVDNDSGLLPGKKQKKKREIETKHEKLKTSRDADRDRRVEAIKVETKHATDIAEAEYKHREALSESKSALDAADNNNKTRDDAAKAERDDALSNIDQSLSQQEQDAEKVKIDDKYREAIKDSKTKYNDEKAAAEIEAEKKQHIANTELKHQKAIADSELEMKRSVALVDSNSQLSSQVKRGQKKFIGQAHTKKDKNLDSRLVAWNKDIEGRYEDKTAANKLARENALVDADTSKTEEEKKEQKLENQKEYDTVHKEAQKKIDEARKEYVKLLTPEEKKAAAALELKLSQEKENSDKIKNPYAKWPRIKHHLAGANRWKKAISSMRIKNHGVEEEEEEEQITLPPLPDLLVMVKQFSTEDQGAAVIMLPTITSDEAVQKMIFISTAVNEIRTEAKDNLLRDMLREAHGTDLGVLTTDDKLAILKDAGLDIDPGLSQLEIIDQFDDYVDAMVSVLPPSLEQKKEMLKTTGNIKLNEDGNYVDKNNNVMTDADIESEFNTVISEGHQSLENKVTNGKADDYKRVLFPAGL